MLLIKIEARQIIIDVLNSYYASVAREWEDALIATTIEALNIKGKDGKPPESEIVLYFAPVVQLRDGAPDIIVYCDAAGFDDMLGHMGLQQIIERKNAWAEALSKVNGRFQARVSAVFHAEWKILVWATFGVVGQAVSQPATDQES